MSSLEGKGNSVNGLMSVGTGFRLLHVAGLERRESPSDQVRGRPQTSLRPLPSGRGNRCPLVQSVFTNNRKVRFGRVLRGSRAAPLHRDAMHQSAQLARRRPLARLSHGDEVSQRLEDASADAVDLHDLRRVAEAVALLTVSHDGLGARLSDVGQLLESIEVGVVNVDLARRRPCGASWNRSGDFADAWGCAGGPRRAPGGLGSRPSGRRLRWVLRRRLGHQPAGRPPAVGRHRVGPLPRR